MNDTKNLPDHLGGQCTGNVDVALIQYLKETGMVFFFFEEMI